MISFLPAQMHYYIQYHVIVDRKPVFDKLFGYFDKISYSSKDSNI